MFRTPHLPADISETIDYQDTFHLVGISIRVYLNFVEQVMQTLAIDFRCIKVEIRFTKYDFTQQFMSMANE